MTSKNADSLVILDFETTGLSPDKGDRAIEIGAVRIKNGEITDTFQELMNPGRRISSFIENYTGISNRMLQTASTCKDVMNRFADFISDDNLLAHNASFDKRFLDAEFSRINRNYSGDFACSLLVSRRLNQDAPDHKLGTLIRYKNIYAEGSYHRALFDSEMTTKLWLAMMDDIKQRCSLNTVPFALIRALEKQPKNSVNQLLTKWSAA